MERIDLARSDGLKRAQEAEDQKSKGWRLRMKLGGVQGTMRKALSEQHSSGNNRPTERIYRERSGRKAPPEEVEKNRGRQTELDSIESGE